MELVKENTLVYICVSKSISSKLIRMQQMLIVRRLDSNPSVHIVLFANCVCIDLSHRIDQLMVKREEEEKKTNLFSLNIVQEHLQLPFENIKEKKSILYHDFYNDVEIYVVHVGYKFTKTLMQYIIIFLLHKNI